MSLPVIFKAAARLEFDEAVAWLGQRYDFPADEQT